MYWYKHITLYLELSANMEHTEHLFQLKNTILYSFANTSLRFAIIDNLGNNYLFSLLILISSHTHYIGCENRWVSTSCNKMNC